MCLDIEENANALVTTPGAARVYRARSDQSSQLQSVEITAKAGTLVEWLPLENIIFPRANAQLNTHIRLSANARFAGWDITCLGLPADGQRFTCGCARQRFQVDVDGQPRLVEAWQVDDTSAAMLDSDAGWRGQPVSGILAAGPFIPGDPSIVDALRSIDTAPYRGVGGISCLHEFVVARYLGDCVEGARDYFTRCWEIVRPALVARPACRPRIWST